MRPPWYTVEKARRTIAQRDKVEHSLGNELGIASSWQVQNAEALNVIISP